MEVVEAGAGTDSGHFLSSRRWFTNSNPSTTRSRLRSQSAALSGPGAAVFTDSPSDVTVTKTRHDTSFTQTAGQIDLAVFTVRLQLLQGTIRTLS